MTYTHKITQLLANSHISPETAYVVQDYPYGFRLRCQIRYWIEYRPKFGFRFMSQTSNPKKPGLVWNKPKGGTYCRFGMAMYLDDQGHVCHAGLSEYSSEEETAKFIADFGPAIPETAEGTQIWQIWYEALKRRNAAIKAKREAEGGN